jgi:hypothetical protein
MTTAALAPPAAPPLPISHADVVWKRLSRLLAAPGRGRMRIWNPETEKFSDTAKRTDRLPTRPAALYLYSHGRTQLLWLDFDAKYYGAESVDADIATAASWITQCGGLAITDRSTSGGRHLMCPLATGTAASRDELVPLVRLLAARLRTLDITPNTNAETGCMTPPGSPCREGGFRQLDGTLDDAIEAFTTRSAPALLPRLYLLLGALTPRPHQPAAHATPATADLDTYTTGAGDQQRLAAPYVRDDPLPAEVADYATRGVISSSRPTWQSNHEARMSVVAQAALRGHSLASLRAMITPGAAWHNGLGRAYERYRHRADLALSRDFTKALTWLVTNVVKSSPPRHKIKYSPGGQPQGPRGPTDLRDWLGNATAWADREFAGKRYRWTVHAVLQTVAFFAVVGGEQRTGTWLVGVGGRSLSIGSGLLSEDTIWRVLADLRERPGAPLVLARHHIGTEPDVYALTSQNRVTTDPARAERVRIEPIHDAWIVLGHHLRRIYELIAHHGLTNKADIYAAAAVPRATGDTMITDLEVAGLITRTGRGTVTRGPVDLDTIAQQHRLDEHRTARIERHHAERSAWKSWLADRERLHHGGAASPQTGNDAAPSVMPDNTDDATEHAYRDAVMATGPPPLEDTAIEHDAIEMIAELLGGRIVTAA